MGTAQTQQAAPRGTACGSLSFGVPDAHVVIHHEPDLTALHTDRITRVVQSDFRRVSAMELPDVGLLRFQLGRQLAEAVRLRSSAW